MIDIDNEIISVVKTAAPDLLHVYGIEVRVPKETPCASVIQIGNSTQTNYQDSSLDENYAQITFEIKVYSDSPSDKKNIAKSNMLLVDTAMIQKGFSRSMTSPLSVNDGTLYYMVCRYKAIVSKELEIYGR